MKSKLSLQTKFYLLVVPLTVLSLLMLFSVIRQAWLLRTQFEQVERSVAESSLSNRLARTCDRAEDAYWDFLTSGNREDRQRLADRSAEIAQILDEFTRYSAASRDTETVQQLERVKNQYAKLQTGATRTEHMLAGGNTGAAQIFAAEQLEHFFTVDFTPQVSGLSAAKDNQLRENVIRVAAMSAALFPPRVLPFAVQEVTLDATGVVAADRFNRQLMREIATAARYTALYNKGKSVQREHELWSAHLASTTGLDELIGVAKEDTADYEGLQQVQKIQKLYRGVSETSAEIVRLAREHSSTARSTALDDTLESQEVALNNALDQYTELQTRQLRESSQHLRSALNWAQWFVALFSGGFLGLAVGAPLLFARGVVAPVSALTAATRQLGRGELDIQVPHSARGEVGELAEAFNAMARSLASAKREGDRQTEALQANITERNRAYQELEQSEDRLRRLVEANVIGLIFINSDGKIHYANKAFLEMTGYTRQNLAQGGGIFWSDITTPEFKFADEAAMHEVAESGAFHPYEKEFIKQDGSKLPVLIGGARYAENKNAIVFVLDLTDLKKAQTELGRLARIVETTDEAIISLSLDGEILSWNNGAARLFGYPASEIVGQSGQLLVPKNLMDEFEFVQQIVGSGKSLNRYETERVTKSGELKPLSITISPLLDQSGSVVGMSKIISDLTQVKKNEQLEQQLRLAQKLEGLGRLAGGVAHDFNNLLMIITSYTEMLQEQLAPEDNLRRNTHQVLKAAEKAAGLTQQLLAFSRKQVLLLRVLDLNAVVDDTAKMIRRIIGEDIDMVFLPSTPLWCVKSDPGQITQVLVNLCVNARDAMPDGGHLTVATRNLAVDEQAASAYPGFLPGSYVTLIVSDTGSGMTKEVKDRIFEPFFTTKELGKGTGLGLATVYGIVKQSGGYIWVDSEPGKGTSFKVYLPKVDELVTAAAHSVAHSPRSQGETILVVEDEAPLRQAICEHLEDRGYVTLQARNGQEALELANHSGQIHLLLTDVIMPGMSGVELVDRLKKMGLEVPALFMSGYTDETIVKHGVLQDGVAFIQKPFALSDLERKLRELLSAKPHSETSA
jgi:two-component system cell cycle sensor histidine kinase/response regulator CckA